MTTAKFCSACGELLKAPRAGLALMRAHCGRCAPRFRAWQFLRITNFVLLLVIAFGVGRYLTPQRPHYLIGTPIDPAPAEPDRDAGHATPTASQAATAAHSADTMARCGAPTRSGKPCRRMVRGGGYCYQHRDKNGQRNATTERPSSPAGGRAAQ